MTVKDILGVSRVIRNYKLLTVQSIKYMLIEGDDHCHYMCKLPKFVIVRVLHATPVYAVRM
jgi:hypothetical protein